MLLRCSLYSHLLLTSFLGPQGSPRHFRPSLRQRRRVRFSFGYLLSPELLSPDLLRRTLVDLNLFVAGVGARSASRCARYAKSHKGHSSTGCNICERRAVMSLGRSDGRTDAGGRIGVTHRHRPRVRSRTAGRPGGGRRALLKLKPERRRCNGCNVTVTSPACDDEGRAKKPCSEL